MKESTKALKKKIKSRLDKERYQHTLGVAYTASCLAMRYGEDMEKAYIAGLLHDCAKCIPNEEKLKLCRKYDIELSETEKAVPSLIHAKLGAYLCEQEYGITDPDIVGAVRTHTTGAPGMSLLQKIIFAADYIEPNRDAAPNLEEVRGLCFTDLDAGVYRILSDTLNYLNGRKDGAVDPATRETHDYYEELLARRGRDETGAS